MLAARLTNNDRAIVLSTDRHKQAVHYALVMPRLATPSKATEPATSLSQLSAMELTYNLTGVEIRYASDAGETSWEMWAPHIDLVAADGLLTGCSERDRLAAALAVPGKITLRTQLDLWQMLRPATQPGSQLDATFPDEEVTVTLESTAAFTIETPTAKLSSSASATGLHTIQWQIIPKADEWLPIKVVAATGPGAGVLRASWHTAEDNRPRAIAAHRFLLPWARPIIDESSFEPALPPELAQGDWRHGRELFYGQQAQCGACHKVRGQGGWIGPDLSNLVHRDYASVVRDIANPSFAINPEHLAYAVELDDGRTLAGMVQRRGDDLVIGDIKGVETVVPRASIASMEPALISIMPEGLPKAVGEAGMRDLLAFLLLPEPSELAPAPIERGGAPPPRSRAEVGAVLKDAVAVDAQKLKPLTILLVAGPKDHGTNEHDYPEWQARWAILLGMSPAVKVTKVDVWPTPHDWETADAAMFFSANPAWSPERAKELDRFFSRGGGAIFLHFAVNGQRSPDELARRIGLAWQDGSRFRHGDLELHFNQSSQHPIVANFPTARFVDESYWNLAGDPTKIQILATQTEEGQARPMLWTFEPPGGRVFCSLLGHYNWTFDDPLNRILLLRALAWVTREPIDRFNELVTPGARIEGSTQKPKATQR